MLETHQRTEENRNLKQSHHDIVRSPNLSRTVNRATKILDRGNKTEFSRLLMEANVVTTEMIEPPYQY
jgi:hypothetical protein